MPLRRADPDDAETGTGTGTGEGTEPAGRHDAGSPTDAVRRQTAAVAVFLLGLNLAAPYGLTTGLFVGLGLLPVWVVALRRYRGAVLLAVLAVLAVANGVVLAQASTARLMDVGNGTEVVLQLTATICGAGLILWCRQVLPVHRIALLYGLGATLSALPRVPGSENPWKYELSIPVTVTVLALAVRGRSTVQSVALLAGLGTVGVLNDHRSYLGFCLATLALTLWQSRPRRSGRRARPIAQIALLAVSAVLVYQVGSALMLNGAFGRTLQLRSQAQVREAGSLLLGGRPEWTATVRLMRQTPMGFGPGAVPTATDLSVGRAGLYTTNVSTLKGYIANYMFNERFKLHSLAADLWSNFGVAGLALAGTTGAAVLLALARRLADRRASVLVVYLSLNALWSLAFEPIYSALAFLAPAIGFVLLARAPAGAAPAEDAVP